MKIVNIDYDHPDSVHSKYEVTFDDSAVVRVEHQIVRSMGHHLYDLVDLEYMPSGEVVGEIHIGVRKKAHPRRDNSNTMPPHLIGELEKRLVSIKRDSVVQMGRLDPNTFRALDESVSGLLRYLR